MFFGDPLMVFFGVLGMYAFVRWIGNQRWRYLLLSSFCISMAVLLKLVALYLGLPILYLCLAKYKLRFVKEVPILVFGVLVLLPPLLWYHHAHQLYLEFRNTFGILSGGSSKLARLDLFLHPAFYTTVAGRLSVYLFTPLIFLLCLYGLTKWQQTTVNNVTHVWFIGVLAFFVVAARGVFAADYYLLPLLPPGVVLASSGLFAILNSLHSTALMRTKRRKTLVTVSESLLLICTLLGAHYLFNTRVVENEDRIMKRLKAVGQHVGTVTEKGSLIIVASAHERQWQVRSQNELDTPAHIFYFSDRRGWYVAMRWLKKELIEQRRAEGARYLVVPGNESAEFKSTNPIYKYLLSSYRVSADDEGCLVFDLVKAPA
jgi:hypothetical protein